MWFGSKRRAALSPRQISSASPVFGFRTAANDEIRKASGTQVSAGPDVGLSRRWLTLFLQPNLTWHSCFYWHPTTPQLARRFPSPLSLRIDRPYLLGSSKPAELPSECTE